MTSETEPASEEVLAHSRASAGFEAVLANAAFGGFGGLLPPAELGRLAKAVVRSPKPVARRVVDLAARLGHVGIGVEDQPGARDRRFADRAWAGNPVLQRLALGYLATCDAASGILEDADVDWRTRERLRLTLDNVASALSPTNGLLTNPESWKEVIDTGGQSLRAGLGNLLTDLRSPAKLPTSVDKSAFELGSNLAATAGQVVRKTRVYELIQYQPRADKVNAVPLLVIPSPVNKYYLLDLEPEQSVARAELDAGRQVFIASWVNPDASHADVGFDEYVIGIVEMLNTVAAISGSDASHLLGLCGGGVLAFLAAAYLAAIGRERLLASLTVAIAVLDYDRGPSAMAFLDRKGAERAIRRATEHGFFDARDAARAFALIRPIEGIWNIAVHNYLLGKQPPAMGLLYWAADQTNMATKFGGQMMRAALENSLTRPGGVTVGGVPIDPSADHRRHLRPRRLHRPHLTMAGLLSDHRHDRRRRDVRPREGRPRDRHSQGTGQPAKPATAPERSRSSDPGRVARELRRQHGQLVGALERLDREAHPGQEAGPDAPRQRCPSTSRRRAG